MYCILGYVERLVALSSEFGGFENVLHDARIPTNTMIHSGVYDRVLPKILELYNYYAIYTPHPKS